MAFEATVLRALIASPSDTVESRRALRQAIEDWSSLHGEETGIVILPLMWERDAHPETGHPQSVVNRQLGDRSDLVVATFWTRAGTPTDEGDSGSIEEVERAIEAKKPVLLYFSSVPAVLDNLDQDQLGRLKEFRKRMERESLFDTYANTEELVRKVTSALTQVVRERFHAEVGDAPLPQGRAQIVATVEREPRVRTDARGRVTQSTNYSLLVENVGSAPAEDVRIATVVREGQDPNQLPQIHDGGDPVGRLVPGNPLRYLLLIFMGTLPQFDVELTWKEGDQEFREVQTLRW